MHRTTLALLAAIIMRSFTTFVLAPARRLPTALRAAQHVQVAPSTRRWLRDALLVVGVTLVWLVCAVAFAFAKSVP